MAGFPGTRAALWQQVGRAGRGGQDALGVLVARDDPLDTYLVNHPEALLGAPVEANVFDPDNPYVLGPHLCAAAAELPLTEEDLPLFGPRRPRRRRRADRGAACCAGAGTAGSGPTGAAPATSPTSAPAAVPRCGWSRTAPAGCSAPSTRGSPHGTVHDGRGLPAPGRDLPGRSSSTSTSRVAMVVLADPDYTHLGPRDHRHRDHSASASTPRWGAARVSLGEVRVTHQVVSFLRAPGARPARCSARSRSTCRSAPSTPPRSGGRCPPALLGGRRRRRRATCPGAAHAAEHASIGLLPLFATCDRWDIGGVSTALHPDTGLLTVFVYDGHPGGAGFAERGFHAARAWLDRDAGGDRRLPVRGRLPVLRAVAQVRQPEQPARQARRGRPARRPARRRLTPPGLPSPPREQLRTDRLRKELPMLVLGLILILLSAGSLVARALQRHRRQGGALRRQRRRCPRWWCSWPARRPADLHHGPRAGPLRASAGPTRTARPRRSSARSRSARSSAPTPGSTRHHRHRTTTEPHPHAPGRPGHDTATADTGPTEPTPSDTRHGDPGSGGPVPSAARRRSR